MQEEDAKLRRAVTGGGAWRIPVGARSVVLVDDAKALKLAVHKVALS